MSIGAQTARILFIIVGVVFGITAFALLFTSVDLDSKDGRLYVCGGVLNRHDDLEDVDDPERICDAALQTRAQGAQVAAMLALGAFVAAGAVAIGGRHRIAVEAYEPSPKPPPAKAD